MQKEFFQNLDRRYLYPSFSLINDFNFNKENKGNLFLSTKVTGSSRLQRSFDARYQKSIKIETAHLTLMRPLAGLKKDGDKSKKGFTQLCKSVLSENTSYVKGAFLT